MRARRQHGVALVLVLWVITLLTVIAGNFAYSMRGEAQIAANLMQNAQAESRADAGVQRAWFELMKPPGDPSRWRADGVPHQFLQQGIPVQVAIYDEAGKIDLNTAPEALIAGLMRSIGLDEPTGSALAAAILDWRSPGMLKRINGAKEDDYRAAGKDYGPPNAPFQTVDEVQRVLGMTPEVYRRIAPSLTVYSGQPGINTSVASRDVLLAIPGANLGMVEAFLRQREEALLNNQPLPTFAAAGAVSAASGTPSAYFIRSEVRMGEGSGFVREVVGRLNAGSAQQIRVLSWGEGDTQPATVNNTTARN